MWETYSLYGFHSEQGAIIADTCSLTMLKMVDKEEISRLFHFFSVSLPQTITNMTNYRLPGLSVNSHFSANAFSLSRIG